MLQGLTEAKAEVGLFTVIKTAAWGPNGQLQMALRLVFDKRVPNLLWAKPPWVAPAGPGSLSSMVCSEMLEEPPRPPASSLWQAIS